MLDDCCGGILECNSDIIHRYKNIDIPSCYDDMELFWNRKKNRKKYNIPCCCYVPENTIWCDYVVPIRVVEHNCPIVYKVVYTNKDRVHESVCRNPNMPIEARIIYNIGKIIKPNIKNSKIFCFNSISNAKLFIEKTFNNYYGNFKIMECIGDIDNNFKLNTIPDVELLLRFWNSYNIMSKYLTLQKIPEGTVYCNSVYPIKVLDN
jgi:hypothetical protein